MAKKFFSAVPEKSTACIDCQSQYWFKMVLLAEREGREVGNDRDPYRRSVKVLYASRPKVDKQLVR